MPLPVEKTATTTGVKNDRVYSVSRSDFFTTFSSEVRQRFANVFLKRPLLHLIKGSYSGSVVDCYTNVP